MPEAVSITFRDQITGKINDLLIDEHRASAETQNLLGYLVGAVLSYRDEGIEFAPSIVICDSLSDFLKPLPGSVSYKIGSAPLDPTSGAKILKDCAPLSGPNWFIFIERRSDNSVNYGVFTYYRTPTAISLQDSVSLNNSLFCLLLRKISSNTVEIRGAKGNLLTLIFSTTRGLGNGAQSIDDFSLFCCKDIEDSESKNNFRSYFVKLLEETLSASHGTILVCSKTPDLATIPGLKDAILLNPILSLHDAFLEFQGSGTAGSILHLQRCEQLLQGFVRCDGMVIFDTTGNVIAYRVFYSAPAVASSGLVGGARRRAFEGLKPIVGTALEAALFRSQDGLTLHHGVIE